MLSIECECNPLYLIVEVEFTGRRFVALKKLADNRQACLHHRGLETDRRSIKTQDCLGDLCCSPINKIAVLQVLGDLPHCPLKCIVEHDPPVTVRDLNQIAENH